MYRSKNEIYLKTFGRTRLCTGALNCSVLAVVAEEFVCGIASCEGRLLEEVELQEYVESCCALLPYIIYNNGVINRNSNHLIICSLAGNRRNGITAVLSCQPKLKQQQNKQNKFIHSTKRLHLYSWGYNKYFSLKKIHWTVLFPSWSMWLKFQKGKWLWGLQHLKK